MIWRVVLIVVIALVRTPVASAETPEGGATIGAVVAPAGPLRDDDASTVDDDGDDEEALPSLLPHASTPDGHVARWRRGCFRLPRRRVASRLFRPPPASA